MEEKQELRICKECGRELPINAFTTGRGKNGKEFRRSVCAECCSKKQKEGHQKKKDEAVAKAKSMRLKDFTARELMEELSRRGYKGKLKFVEVHEIDIERF